MRRASPSRAVAGGLLVALVGLAASGCSYRFVAPGSQLPGGVRSVQVPLYENATSEPGAELPFTEAMRQGLLRAGRLGETGAEAVLSAKVVSVGTVVLIATPGRLPTYRVNAVLSYSLTRGGKVLAATTLSTLEDFPAGADPLWTETNRGLALSRVAEAAAHDALEWLGSVP